MSKLARVGSRYFSTTKYLLQPTADATQFSKSRLVYHGELEYGQIPEALKYSKNTQITTLSNGLRVATEYFQGQKATVGVHLNVGSRHEAFSKSGLNNLSQKAAFLGTEKLTKEQLLNQIYDRAAQSFTNPGREQSTVGFQVLKQDVNWAVDTLYQLLFNPTLNSSDLEVLKQQTLQEVTSQNLNPEKFTLENVHFTAFRDHMIGQPVLGNRKSVLEVSADDIRKWISKNYFTSNLVVVGTGEIEHEKFVNQVESVFGNVRKASSEPLEEGQELVLTPSCIYVRDDDKDHCHAALMVRAPSKYHEDYFAFQLLTHIWGEYVPSRDSIINDPSLQYNTLHQRLGEYDDIAAHKGFYFPYKEMGLAGHFFSSIDVSSRYIWDDLVFTTRELCYLIHEHEMYRAKNSLYHNLIDRSENQCSTFKDIGEQLLTYNRRINRSEFALRIAHLTPQVLKKTYKKYLLDPDLAFAAYGACDFIMHVYDETQHDWARMKDVPF